MTDKDIKTTVDDIKASVAGGRLHDAFSKLKELSERLMTWEITSAIISLEDSYKYMLDYAAKGMADPGRENIYRSICSDILTNADRMARHWLRRESPTLYFNTLRVEGRPGSDSITSLLADHYKLEEKLSIFGMVADGTDNNDSFLLLKDKELIEKRLFDRLWVSFPMHPEAAEAIRTVITTDRHSKDLRYMLLCALILGELQYHDDERMLLLMDAYLASNDNVLAMAALAGIMLGMYAHPSRPLSSKVIERLDSVREKPSWPNDVKTVFMEFISTKDTERITRKMRDEVIPQVLKLRPDVSKKFNAEDGIDIENLEENPEWQELLDKSGITERLKELSDLQEEGADVFMGAFSQLKSFPFFNDIVNWFRLFNSSHSALGKDNRADGTIMEMLSLSPMLCNSDKFSFALSVVSMPEAQRKMMTGQLEAQSAHMAELSLASVATVPVARKMAAKMFIQDMYRFFKLFRRKGEFLDPFTLDFNPGKVEYLRDELSDAATLGTVGEFYFKRHYWKEAKAVLMSLAETQPPSALIYQKLGYCYQKDGEIAAALECYEQAELLNAENHWTLRRIATCHRLLGNLNKSLDYFLRVEKFYPDDVNLAMNIGHTLLEAGREKEAVDYYYKADYLDQSSTKAWRPLAWCLFRLKDFKASRRYYERILADKPVPEDYLNMGHLSLAENDFKDAVNYYSMYAELSPAGIDGLLKAIDDDKETLLGVGIDKSIIPLVLDTILYSINND